MLEKGDHVGIWAKNVPEWLTFMFATAKIGAVLVTVNTAYKKVMNWNIFLNSQI